MALTEEQEQTIRSWADEGLGLSEIQKKINSELGLSMTYMDARFLVIDLGIELKDKPASRSAAGDADQPAASQQREESPEDGAAADEAPAPGEVSVEVDVITKPGAVVSGTVTFSDGVTAAWFLDQLGRLAIDAAQPGYKPGEQDLRDFQGELRTALEKKGF